MTRCVRSVGRWWGTAASAVISGRDLGEPRGEPPSSLPTIQLLTRSPRRRGRAASAEQWAERPGGLEVDHELEFGGLHDWQVAGFSVAFCWTAGPPTGRHNFRMLISRAGRRCSSHYSRYGVSTSSIHFMNARTRRDRLLRCATTRDTASARRRLKRSTQNLQLSTRTPADYPIFGSSTVLGRCPRYFRLGSHTGLMLDIARCRRRAMLD